MTNDTKRIRMKIGDSEFEADVPSDEVVQQMYDRFLAAIEKRAAESQVTPIKASDPKPPKGSSDAAEKPPAEAADGLTARIFELRPDGYVTLKMLPKGDQKEADAFLLLLYGYRKLKGEETVLATHLLRSAEFSGLQAYRPAHALTVHERYVIRGGYKKGSTYALNNQGLPKAEEIAAKIFE
jgi:hypothetical protein